MPREWKPPKPGERVRVNVNSLRLSGISMSDVGRALEDYASYSGGFSLSEGSAKAFGEALGRFINGDIVCDYVEYVPLAQKDNRRISVKAWLKWFKHPMKRELLHAIKMNRIIDKLAQELTEYEDQRVLNLIKEKYSVSKKES